MRFWPRSRRPRPRDPAAERALDERGDEISDELVERGMEDLDHRHGLLGSLERRLEQPGKRKRDRS
jgi:hypothetical protein